LTHALACLADIPGRAFHGNASAAELGVAVVRRTGVLVVTIPRLSQTVPFRVTGVVRGADVAVLAGLARLRSEETIEGPFYAFVVRAGVTVVTGELRSFAQPTLAPVFKGACVTVVASGLVRQHVGFTVPGGGIAGQDYARVARIWTGDTRCGVDLAQTCASIAFPQTRTGVGLDGTSSLGAASASRSQPRALAEPTLTGATGGTVVTVITDFALVSPRIHASHGGVAQIQSARVPVVTGADLGQADSLLADTGQGAGIVIAA
jgi:hypothetical protein